MRTELVEDVRVPPCVEIVALSWSEARTFAPAPLGRGHGRAQHVKAANDAPLQRMQRLCGGRRLQHAEGSAVGRYRADLQFPGFERLEGPGKGGDAIHQIDDIEIRPEVERRLESGVKAIAPGLARQLPPSLELIAFRSESLAQATCCSVAADDVAAEAPKVAVRRRGEVKSVSRTGHPGASLAMLPRRRGRGQAGSLARRRRSARAPGIRRAGLYDQLA